MIKRLTPDDFPVHYRAAVERLPEGDLLQLFQEQGDMWQIKLKELSEAEAESAYAPGKWTVKELLGHMLDTERVMAYRAMCISRGEQQPLPGFEEDDYVRHSGSNNRRLSDLLEELKLLRASSLALFRSFTPEMLERSGTANGRSMSVLFLLHIIAAHDRHHLHILQERYLVPATA